MGIYNLKVCVLVTLFNFRGGEGRWHRVVNRISSQIGLVLTDVCGMNLGVSFELRVSVSFAVKYGS